MHFQTWLTRCECRASIAFMQSHILSIILITPLVGALVLLFVSKENKDAIRWIANVFALGGFLISGGHAKQLDPLDWRRL